MCLRIMKIKNLLSIPFYEFDCPANILEQVIDEVSKLPYPKSDKQSFSQLYYNKLLVDFIEVSLEEIRQFYYHDDVRLYVSGMWATKLEKLKNGNFHLHANSIISGILYLSDEEISKTFFKIDNPYLKVQQEGFLTIGKQQELHMPQPIIGHSIPKKGKLLCFPSTIKHGVATHIENTTRFSVSFNSFIEGSCSPNDSTTHLSLPKIDFFKNNLNTHSDSSHKYV